MNLTVKSYCLFEARPLDIPAVLNNKAFGNGYVMDLTNLPRFEFGYCSPIKIGHTGGWYLEPNPCQPKGAHDHVPKRSRDSGQRALAQMLFD